jgi:hypothetical protein
MGSWTSVEEEKNIADVVHRNSRSSTQSLSVRFSVTRVRVWRTLRAGMYPYRIERIQTLVADGLLPLH